GGGCGGAGGDCGDQRAGTRRFERGAEAFGKGGQAAGSSGAKCHRRAERSDDGGAERRSFGCACAARVHALPMVLMEMTMIPIRRAVIVAMIASALVIPASRLAMAADPPGAGQNAGDADTLFHKSKLAFAAGKMDQAYELL